MYVWLSYITSSPQRLVRLHLVGEYVPIFPTGFLGFRIRRLHKFYSLSGIYFYVSLVTNILFDLCNETRTALNTQAHSSSCTPIPVFES